MLFPDEVVCGEFGYDCEAHGSGDLHEGLLRPIRIVEDLIELLPLHGALEDSGVILIGLILRGWSGSDPQLQLRPHFHVV